ERLLRGLIENVKESDSMIKLSRLVSSQIQAAIHPKSIHFFYEDQTNSEFSLGFTTAENSGKMRLAADSPLLHFMRSRNSTVEFPSAETEELPTAELEWLRQIETNLIVPMHGTDDNLVGFFSLGEKLSEIPYTNRDKELLETLADQIALVHENINLKDRMRSDLRIRNEVLSRFEAGDVNLLKECPRCGRCYDRTDTKCDDDGAELTFSLPVERTIEKRYRLQRLIGKGGMGAVYEATDERIGRSVAVKILSSSLFGNREAQRRFEREARTSGQLSHRNIVAIYDYGVLSTEGAFLVMELVRGETLSNVLRSERTLETNTVVDWFEQVLNGLEIAHNSGIIHRDLKPDNILVARDDNADRLRILDFGLARFNKSDVEGSVTMPGTVMGTLGYMSPEQLQGQRAAERSDLFSVGVIIFECLYGKRPFPGRTYLEIVQSMNQPRNFDLAEPFGSFFQTALADDPVLRFSNAATMKETLRGLREQ
ncbi:MAG: protein kinase domain-containing protein, partial [Pyrinomonadaceae bacterium]